MKGMIDAKNQIKKAVIGKDQVIEQILMTMIARGHILLEDIPGVGKTNLALAFSKSMSLDYHRIQLTSDVLPSDIVGFTMYNAHTHEFEYKPGIAFCHLLLADEINRTSSKTQAALLQLMEEGQISVDGQTHQLPQPFFVIATQNPFGSAGTQLLPDSQLDRFMVRLSLGYPSLQEEIEILKTRQKINPLEKIQTVLTPEELLEYQHQADNVYINDVIYTYMVQLIDATRHHPMIKQGVSPRGTLALMKMAKACAFLHNRDYVIPKDVQKVVPMTLGHRILLSDDALMKDLSVSLIIDDIVKKVKVPGLYE